MSDAHERNGESGSESSALADLIDRLTGKMQAGEPIDWDGVLRQNPDHAEEVLRLRPALGALGRLSKSGPEELSGLAAPAGAEDGSVSGLLGDFRIGREIGRGGMGVVYEAEQMSLGRRVALKVLPFAGAMDPRRLQRFQNEARAAACLNHPHIVPVYYVGSERGVSFYAMQYIDGKTAADLIQELRQPSVTRPAPAAASPDDRTTACPAPGAACDPTATTETTARQSTPTVKSAVQNAEFFRRAAGWAVQAAEALDHAHQAAIVHRDVKPANLLLDGSGYLWVTDFGLAHVRHGEDGLTMTGDLVGTLRYMSPEQALAKRVPIDHRTDVYSLGATLYELLTLRPALDGTDRQQILRQIALEEPPAPRRLNKAIPHDLEIIVLKAMEKNAADRYGTAREMADDLRRFLDDKPIRARRPPLTAQLARWRRRHTALVAALTAAIVAAVAVLGASVGWVVRDRALRSAETARAVVQALDESASWQQKRRLPEAQSAARRAVALVASGEADDALRKRVRARTADLELLAGMENARLAMSESIGGKLDLDRTDGLYRDAFRTYGLDLEVLPPEEAGERLRESTAAVEISALLDHWSIVRRDIRGPDDASWKHLLGVARAADPDAVRVAVREALMRRDVPALAELTRSDKLFDLQPVTLQVIALTLQALGETERAVALLREARRQRPDDFWENFDLASTLRRHSVPPKPDEAIRFYTAALALRPQSASVHGNLGNALADEGQVDEAIQEERRAIELDSKFAGHHYNLGHILEYKHQPDKAMQEYRRAIELDPKLATAHNNLGMILMDKGRPDEATEEYRRAIELDPKLAQPHYNLGLLLCKKKQLDEAIRECRRAIELDPKDADAHSTLGMALNGKKQVDEAIKEYRRAIELDPKRAPAHINLGMSLMDKHQLDEAIEEFRRAIEFDPNLALAHNNLGNALKDKGQLDEAMREYRRAVELDPKLGLVHNNLGTVLGMKHQQDEAIEEFRRAIELDPNLAAAHINLGYRLQDKGQLDEAMQEYRRAAELDPTLAPAHHNLGIVLANKHQLDEAMQEYRRAIELDPNSAVDHNNLGMILEDKGRLDEAIQEYRRCIELGPKFPQAYFNLGSVLSKTGKFTESRDAFRKGHQLGSGQPGWPFPSAQWLRQAEFLVQLDRKLNAVLEGKDKPANDAERLSLAQLCQQPFKKFYAASSRLFAEAFAHDAKLADDLRTGNRYNAACAAALAGCGRGEDAPTVEADRAALRAQALKWLRADLAAWKPNVTSLYFGAQTQAVKTLTHWREDDALAGVRGDDTLAKLPEAERDAWRQLWTDLDALLAKAKP